MRKRSYTIEADTIDEYIATAQKTTSYLVPSHPFPSRNQLPSNQNINPNSSLFIKSLNPSKSASGKFKAKTLKATSLQDADFNYDEDNELESKPKIKPKGPGHWEGFDFDSDLACGILNQKTGELNSDLDPEQLQSRLPSMALSENTADTDSSEDYDRKARKTIVRRIMVIGQNGTGKHSLINGAFKCENQGLKVPGQVMDLLTRTEDSSSGSEDENVEVKYQFWMQNLPAEDEGDEKLRERFEDIIKLYYRRVELFVFMYSIADKKSFSCLEKAVQKVLEQVSIEKFAGVLLGTKVDLEEKREVPVFDGIALQEKHKLTFFMETNLVDKGLKGKLVQLLNELDEGKGEMIARKGHSILSIE